MLASYRTNAFRGDLTAGLTTAVLLVPQAMAYALLAGLPPQYGLYAASVPLLAYALVGTSRVLAVGPVAVVALLIATGVGELAEPGSSEFISRTILLAAMVGVMQLVMGLLRVGFVTNLLSHPVITGFTAAAALIIGFSQLDNLLGMDLTRSSHVHEIVVNALGHLDTIHPWTSAIGLTSLVILVLMKKLAPKLPCALIVVILGTIIVAAIDLDDRGVAIVGRIPSGFPPPSLPSWSLQTVFDLTPVALAITFVGFIESISVAREFASRGRYDVDANRELVGLGLGNLAGSLFGGMPVAGGFSRTAVNADSGAKTRAAGVITALTAMFVLLLLTPALWFLPRTILAAIIMMAVFGLIDLRAVSRLWRVKRSDLLLLSVTFFVTLIIGIEEGILAGVATSVMVFVVRTTHPHTAVLGRLPATNTYRNVRNFPNAETTPGVLIVRIDAQLYFGNIAFLKAELKRLEVASEAPLRAVVLDASSINQVDSSADEALLEIGERYEERGIEMYFAHCKGPVREVIARSGLRAHLGEEHFFFELHDAVQAAIGRTTIDEAPHCSEVTPGASTNASSDEDQ